MMVLLLLMQAGSALILLSQHGWKEANHMLLIQAVSSGNPYGDSLFNAGLQAYLREVDPLLEQLGLELFIGGVVPSGLEVKLHLGHQL